MPDPDRVKLHWSFKVPMIPGTVTQVFAIFTAIFISGFCTASAGTNTEIKLGTSIIAVTSEDRCERLIVAARANDQHMFALMIEAKQAVIIPKGKTWSSKTQILKLPTKDDTGGIARFHIKGSKNHLWTTNQMLSSALWAGDE